MIRFARSRPGLARSKCKKPKARDRSAPEAGERIRFTSSILPNGRGARRASTRSCRLSICADFGGAIFRRFLTALLGKDAPNLSPAVIAPAQGRVGRRVSAVAKARFVGTPLRLRVGGRRLSQARMEPQAECMLVLIGATPEGKKELIGFRTGHAGERAEFGRNCSSI